MSDLMLAGKITDLNELRFPVLASPKLDGIRATVDLRGQVISRNGKLIRNKHVQHLFGFSAITGFDGELIVGDPTSPTCFRDTTSGVMSDDGKPNVTFHVFDKWSTGREYGFHDRLQKIKAFLGSGDDPGITSIKVVPHLTIKTVEELTRYEEVCLAKGYEGVMVRDPNGPYKRGRSTVKEGWLLKLKRFEDSEAIIMDFIELNHNHNEKDESGKRTNHKAGKVGGGILGSFVVKDVNTGVAFEVGTGFTREQRQEFWQNRADLEGLTITYKFFPSGSKDRPRFPVFKGFRGDI